MPLSKDDLDWYAKRGLNTGGQVAPTTKPSTSVLSQEDRDWYAQRGFSYKGMDEEPQEVEPSFIDSASETANSLGKQALSSLSNPLNYEPNAIAAQKNTGAKRIVDDAKNIVDSQIPLAKSIGAGVGEGFLKLGKVANLIPSINQDQNENLLDQAEQYLQGIQSKAISDTEKTGYPVNKSIFNIEHPNQEYLKKPIGLKETASRYAEKAGEGVNNLVKQLTTPQMIGTVAGLGASGIPSGLATASFIPGLAEGTLESGKKVYKDIQNEDYPNALRDAVETLGQGAMTYGAGKHLLSPLKQMGKPFPPPEPPRYQPQELPPLLPAYVAPRVREYIPSEKPTAYVSDTKNLANEPFERKSLKRQKIIENQSEQPIAYFDEANPINPNTGFAAKMETVENRNTPYPNEFSVKEETIPESKKTLQLQMDSLKQNRSKALLVTPGADIPVVSKRFKTLPTDVGVFVYDPMRINPQMIKAKVADGTHGELLGHVEQKSDATTQAVTAVSPDGVEAKSSVVSPENVPLQAKILKEQFPQAKIKVGGEELMKNILEQRQGSVTEESFLSDLIKKHSNETGSVKNPFSRDPNSEYVRELVNKREAARSGEMETNKDKASRFYNEVKVKLVDSNAPIEDAIALSQKAHQYEVLPKYDISHQIDRVYRAPTLAGQFAKDKGFENLIKKVDNLDNLDQYLIARHAKTLTEKGIETGRDFARDEILLKDFAPKYEPYAKQATKYSRDLLDYAVDSGLISKDLAGKLKEIYPDYVPMNRVFTELEKQTGNYGTKAVASLSKQNVIQKIVGSKREIESPIGSLLTKTNEAFAQGEKNKAGRILASYKDLPGFQGLIKEVKPGEHPQHTFSYLENGKKKVFETTPEIEAAAKSLDVQQLNILGKILNAPVRIAKLGITGIYLPFAATNIPKDQLSAFINSNNGLKTSVANPKVFLKALYNAVGHGELYQDLVRNAAGGTSFDIARNQPLETVAKIRSNRSIGSKIKYTVKNPSELLRAVENVIGRSEELTRLSQFEGTLQAELKKGRSRADAEIIAAKAARENSANFYRKGEWGKVLNGAFLYLNAGIQGNRAFVRALERSPVKTGAKIATAVFLPVAMATMWNTSDPKRKEAYDDIEDFEKENNLIIVPNNPTQDGKGNWNIIKMPMQQNLGKLSSVVRRGVETTQGLDPIKAMEVVNNLIGSISPVEPNIKSAVNTLTPQLVKPSLESLTNTNLFTGKKIVPEYLKRRPTEYQVYPWSSGTARQIGKKVGASPIKTEQFIKSTFGGLGSQALHGSDVLLNKLGIIPENQVNGQEILEAIEARFNKARGGKKRRLSKEKRETR